MFSVIKTKKKISTIYLSAIAFAFFAHITYAMEAELPSELILETIIDYCGARVPDFEEEWFRKIRVYFEEQIVKNGIRDETQLRNLADAKINAAKKEQACHVKPALTISQAITCPVSLELPNEFIGSVVKIFVYQRGGSQDGADISEYFFRNEEERVKTGFIRFNLKPQWASSTVAGKINRLACREKSATHILAFLIKRKNDKGSGEMYVWNQDILVKARPGKGAPDDRTRNLTVDWKDLSLREESLKNDSTDCENDLVMADSDGEEPQETGEQMNS